VFPSDSYKNSYSHSTNNFSFSTPLKARLVAYFHKHYEYEVKDEETDLFLNALSGVYDCLSQRAGTAQSRLISDYGSTMGIEASETEGARSDPEDSISST